MGLISDTIVAEIIDTFEKIKARGLTDTQAYLATAQAMEIDSASVKYHVKALRSTVQLAKRKILAKASVMVDRIIEKAPTSELIDILSRPNVGVLEPAQKGQQGSGGFILSVGIDSLGAVRATAAMLPEVTMPAPPAPVDMNVIDIGEDHGEESSGKSDRIDALKRRLARRRDDEATNEAYTAQQHITDAKEREAQRRTPWLVEGVGYTGDDGVQGADE